MPTQVEVRLKDPTVMVSGKLHLSADGNDWSALPYLPADQCEHGETMCADCRSEWDDDYEIRMKVPS